MSITATYISPNSFSVVGDQTADFDIGRRVKLIGSTTWYGTISNSVYSSVTTVTLTAASDDIDASLTEVYYGIISGTESSTSTNIHSHDGDEGSGGQISHTTLSNIGTKSHTTIDSHIDSTSNPHLVTKSQVGLSNVPNTDFTSAVAANTAKISFDSTSSSKLAGIEAGAEVNNITDINATDLTDGGDSTLHYHSSDRNRSNHTGTQDATTISNFDTAVAANSAVAANTAKVTNATHTGDVTGSGALTIANKQTLTASNGVNVSNSPTVIAASAPAISLTYGTTANTVCQGNDSRLSDARTPTSHTIASHDTTATGAQLNTLVGGGDTTLHDHDGITENTAARHTRSHAISGTSDHTATSHRTFYSNGSSQVVELAHGTAGQFYKANGATSAPSWATLDSTNISNFDTAVAANSAVAANTAKISFDSTSSSKLAGIEEGAEVNNISDINATDLTDAGDSILHYHAADRNRANHTGTQDASTISDFDTEVANNSAVAANTAKISFDSTASTKVGFISVTQAVNLDTMESDIATNNAKVTNATHTGEVTGSTALTIADNVVDEANLKLDTTATNGYVLTADSTASGGMKWAAASGGDPISGATDNSIVRANGATALQGSGITISDTNDIVLPATSSLTCPEKLVIPLNEPTSLENGCIWIA